MLWDLDVDNLQTILNVWEAFSRPELNNFLRVLDREESELISQLEYKYKVMKKIIHQRMKELRREKHKEQVAKRESLHEQIFSPEHRKSTADSAFYEFLCFICDHLLNIIHPFHYIDIISNTVAFLKMMFDKNRTIIEYLFVNSIEIKFDIPYRCGQNHPSYHNNRMKVPVVIESWFLIDNDDEK
ncbi:hypothetical protein KUTeg_020539 [Tegillarca granosa]|uniref:SARAH domain-containing protein n=1 Tax=Tegillarca granosa TaxID=220873 RepID=A0ABQ9E8A7_TEGGR|nr:hypothetical protein KUTeg_020539 [Tegillarca granosa]